MSKEETYPKAFEKSHLDLNTEDSDHECEGPAIDDEAEATDHEPGEDEADDVVLPLGGQPAQHLLQDLHVLFGILSPFHFELKYNLYSCTKRKYHHR